MSYTAPLAFGVLVALWTVTVGASNIDPEHRFAWCENVGWSNWRHSSNGEDGVVVNDTVLSGFVWAENIGWINLGDGFPGDGVHYANIDGDEFGVNIDPVSGDLFGLAWGENVGWINFDTSSLGEDRARLDECEHRFFGYAWGENVAWVNLDDAAHFVGVGPCVAGDLDCDGEVTLDDFASIPSSLSGPDVASACSAFDVDGDNDVDLVDYAELQRSFKSVP